MWCVHHAELQCELFLVFSLVARTSNKRQVFPRLLALLPWQLAGIVPHFGVNKPRLWIRLNSVEQSKSLFLHYQRWSWQPTERLASWFMEDCPLPLDVIDHSSSSETVRLPLPLRSTYGKFPSGAIIPLVAIWPHRPLCDVFIKEATCCLPVLMDASGTAVGRLRVQIHFLHILRSSVLWEEMHLFCKSTSRVLTAIADLLDSDSFTMFRSYIASVWTFF